MSVLLSRLRSSPSLHHLTTPFASTIYQFLSAATNPAPPPLNPHFAPVDYLIESCGLPSDEAIRTFQKMQHRKWTLKCPDKPDAVLSFLRQTGVTKSDIRTAVLREPRILCSSVEKNLRPNLAKLREIGLSIEDISGIISRFPLVWLFNFVAKVDFWMQALGSAEIVSVILKRGASILGSNLEKVIVPNLSFLQEECCISPNQIGQLIKSNPRLIAMTLEYLKLHVKRAEELGIERSSGAGDPYDLSNPYVVEVIREARRQKNGVFVREAGCNKLQVVRRPTLLLYSLEKRLIPRNLVRKLLKSKELPVANQTFSSFLLPTEKQFVEKFVLPYEYDVCGLHEAYKNACAGKVTAT
ncbi:uncharacterized protein LOC144545675 [Carex rostrata]